MIRFAKRNLSGCQLDLLNLIDVEMLAHLPEIVGVLHSQPAFRRTAQGLVHAARSFSSTHSCTNVGESTPLSLAISLSRSSSCQDRWRRIEGSCPRTKTGSVTSTSSSSKSVRSCSSQKRANSSIESVVGSCLVFISWIPQIRLPEKKDVTLTGIVTPQSHGVNRKFAHKSPSQYF